MASRRTLRIALAAAIILAVGFLAYRAARGWIFFNGRLNERNGETHRAKLSDWLSSRNLSHRADWKLAGYDPPFTLPIIRRNEVLVTLR